MAVMSNVREYWYKFADWFAFRFSPGARDADADSKEYQRVLDSITRRSAFYSQEAERYARREERLTKTIGHLESKLNGARSEISSAEQKAAYQAERANELYDDTKIFPELIRELAHGAKSGTRPLLLAYEGKIIYAPPAQSEAMEKTLSLMIESGKHHNIGKVKHIKDRIAIGGELYSVRQVRSVTRDGFKVIELRAMGPVTEFLETAHERSVSLTERLISRLRRRKPLAEN